MQEEGNLSENIVTAVMAQYNDEILELPTSEILPRAATIGIPLEVWLGKIAYDLLILAGTLITIYDMGEAFEFAPAESLEKEIPKKGTEYYIAYTEGSQAGILIGNKVSRAEALAILIESREYAEMNNAYVKRGPYGMGNIYCTNHMAAYSLARDASRDSSQLEVEHHNKHKNLPGYYNHFHVGSYRIADGAPHPHVWYGY